jgi:hypothetical protein
MGCSCRILVARAQHRPTFQHFVAVDSIIPTSARVPPNDIDKQWLLVCNVATKDEGAGMRQRQRRRIWCAGVVLTIDRATIAWRSSCHVRQHSLRCTAAYLCFGGTRAVVAQCRVVEARAALPTIDLASHARWCRRRVRQGCVRYAFTYRCRVVERAQMSDNVDSSRRAVQCRPSTSPPVHGGAAAVCAKVSYDVLVLAVVVWLDERRFRTMSTRPDARCSVDHRCRCACTVVPPSCAPRLPMMYQCSLWWNGGPRADVGQCRLVRRAVQCRSSVSPPLCAGAMERLKCMFTHMVASIETIYSLPRGRFPCDADSPPPNVRQMQRVPALKPIAQATFKRHLARTGM